MSTYLAKFSMTVDVQMSVEATSPDSVRQLINDKLCATASLVNADGIIYDVEEDYIVDVSDLKVEKVE